MAIFLSSPRRREAAKRPFPELCLADLEIYFIQFHTQQEHLATVNKTAQITILSQKIILKKG
jgi:hypothetical protein